MKYLYCHEKIRYFFICKAFCSRKFQSSEKKRTIRSRLSIKVKYSEEEKALKSQVRRSNRQTDGFTRSKAIKKESYTLVRIFALTKTTHFSFNKLWRDKNFFRKGISYVIRNLLEIETRKSIVIRNVWLIWFFFFFCKSFERTRTCKFSFISCCVMSFEIHT